MVPPKININAIFVIVSIDLAILFGLSVYALTKVKYLSLPLPAAVTALTIAAPLLTGASLLTTIRNPSVFWAHRLFFVLTFLVAVLAGLVGPYVSGGPGEKCILDAKWHHLFTSRNAIAIKAIQEALQCCGFSGPLDQPWPFPGGVGARTCINLYGWTRPCWPQLAAAQRSAAGIMLGVLIANWFLHLLGLALTSLRRHRDSVIPDNSSFGRADRYIDDEPSQNTTEATEPEDDQEEEEESSVGIEQANQPRLIEHLNHDQENEWSRAEA